MDKSQVRIEISESGIELENPIFGSRHFDWDEVSDVSALTSMENLDTADSGSLPFWIDSANIQISESDGEGTEEPQLSEFESRVEADQSTVPNEEELWKRIEDATGITYEKGSEKVEFPENTTSSTVFKRLLNYLFDQGYASRDDLPWGSESSKKHWLLNTEPRTKEGEEMPGAREILDGVYFYSKPPSEYMKRYVREFVEDVVLEK